jgi:predicted DNA-binding transcriptional regulator AlpA
MSKRRAEHHAELITGLANHRPDVREPQGMPDAGLTHGPPDAREPRRMLTEAQLLEIVPFARTTLYHMIRNGLFPRATYASPNRRFWFADEIAAWQDALRECDHYNPDRPRRGGRKPGPIAAGLRG